jgi:hypothetical protein
MTIKNPQTLTIDFGVNHAEVTFENGDKVFITQDPSWLNYTARRQSNGSAIGGNFLTIFQAVQYVMDLAIQEDNEFVYGTRAEPSPFTVVGEGYSDGDTLALRMVRDAFPEGEVFLTETNEDGTQTLRPA